MAKRPPQLCQQLGLVQRAGHTHAHPCPALHACDPADHLVLALALSAQACTHCKHKTRSPQVCTHAHPYTRARTRAHTHTHTHLLQILDLAEGDVKDHHRPRRRGLGVARRPSRRWRAVNAHAWERSHTLRLHPVLGELLHIDLHDARQTGRGSCPAWECACATHNEMHGAGLRGDRGGAAGAPCGRVQVLCEVVSLNGCSGTIVLPCSCSCWCCIAVQIPKLRMDKAKNFLFSNSKAI